MSLRNTPHVHAPTHPQEIHMYMHLPILMKHTTCTCPYPSSRNTPHVHAPTQTDADVPQRTRTLWPCRQHLGWSEMNKIPFNMRTKMQNADKSDGTTFNCQRVCLALWTSLSDRMCWEKRKKPRPLTPPTDPPTLTPSPNRPPTTPLSPNRLQVKTTSCFSYNFCFTVSDRMCWELPPSGQNNLLF